MKSKFSILSLFLVALLTSPSLFGAIQASATVSNTQIFKGDIFILIVDINDIDNDYRLDTRPLEKSFTVYHPSQSKSNEYINGKSSKKTQWTVRLQANKTGSFTIPSLKIGDFKTDPIAIKVITQSQIKNKKNTQQGAVFIENSINKNTVYIDQPFIFTTKLYLSKNTNALDLVAPSFEGVDVSAFGQDKNNQTIRNGIRYNIITRQYKMIATQAGQFEINSPILTGELRKLNKWKNKLVGEPINVRGERLNINIKAIPSNYQGDWIVSDDLRLIEDNDLTTQSYRVGDPITRTITLQIASIDKEKLPNVKLNYPKSLRVYPDQDQLQTGQANGLTYGIRIISHAIIADTQGTLTLPEIKINWFNSQTNKAETATLPAQNLTIIAAEQQHSIPATNPVAQVPAKTSIIVDHQTLIYWQITVVILIIIIILMVFYHLSLRRLQGNKIQQPIKEVTHNHYYENLQNSLQKNDAPKCYNMLLQYAQQQYPSLKALNELAEKIATDEENKEKLNAEIKWLQICCSDKDQTWNAHKLSELLQAHQSKTDTPKVKNPMILNP